MSAATSRPTRGGSARERIRPASPEAPEALERRVREDFGGQGFMRALGARLVRVAPGACTLRVGHARALTQQHGYFHGGVLATLADVSGGYAAFTLLPDGARNVTAELKLNLLSPGVGVALVAEAVVLKAGRRLTVCRSEVYALAVDGEREHCATALASYVPLP